MVAVYALSRQLYFQLSRASAVHLQHVFHVFFHRVVRCESSDSEVKFVVGISPKLRNRKKNKMGTMMVNMESAKSFAYKKGSGIYFLVIIK